MTDWNDSPGPGDDVGAMDHVRAAWQTPGGKILAVVPAVVALVVGGALGTAFLGGGSKPSATVAVEGPTA
jgi:hypothetical protein